MIARIDVEQESSEGRWTQVGHIELSLPFARLTFNFVLEAIGELSKHLLENRLAQGRYRLGLDDSTLIVWDGCRPALETTVKPSPGACHVEIEEEALAAWKQSN